MAQQPLLALEVKPIHTPTYGDIMQERDAYRVKQNAMAQEQLKQQQNAMRQMIYRQNVDASGNINQQGVIRGLAQANLGADIPEWMKAYGQGVEAVAKGSNEQLKLKKDLLEFSYRELGNTATPEEAIAAALRTAQQFPTFSAGVLKAVEAVKGMTPEQFGAWKMDALRRNLTAAQQLEQDTQTQDLGGSTRVLMRPKYGSAPFAVAPGSEAQKTMTPQQQYAAQNPAGKVVQDENGNYVVVSTHVPGPVMVGGGGIPGQRGGGVTAGQYGAAIEDAAKQLAPGLVVSGRGRTPERNAEVRGVANSYHLSDNARDLQPAKGQSLDQLAAALAPLKQQGFDVIIERGKNHVHVEPGPNMGGGGGQLQGPTKGKPAATAKDQQAAADKEQQHKALTNELQMALDLVQDPANSSAFQSSKNSWWDNQSQSVLHGKFDPKTAEFGVHTALPGGVAHKSVWDRVTKHLIGAMYQTIKPGQAGMNRAVASQKMHIQMMGGGDNPSRETLIEAIKSTASDYGITLKERSAGNGAAAPKKTEAVDMNNPLLKGL